MFNFLHRISYSYSKMRLRAYRTLQENRFSFIFELGLALFAAIGVLFMAVLLGMHVNLFDVKGSIDQRNAFFMQPNPSGSSAASDTGTAETADDASSSEDESQSVISEIQAGLRNSMKQVRAQVFPGVSFAWASSDEWRALSAALTKDRDSIRRASYAAGISPRMVVSIVIAEQLRFFTSDRESFKKFFEPLKILGTLSQFSLGVSGVKPDTAKQIEDHLKDPSSPYYLGPQYEHLLDAESGSSTDDGARYSRLTDDKDHYYSYLYTALFARQVAEQWKRAGYDISNRPEILATLFNLGFGKSVPKADPQAGGAPVTVGGETYTFGRLGYEFYYSGELAEIFGY